MTNEQETGVMWGALFVVTLLVAMGMSCHRAEYEMCIEAGRQFFC